MILSYIIPYFVTKRALARSREGAGKYISDQVDQKDWFFIKLRVLDSPTSVVFAAQRLKGRVRRTPAKRLIGWGRRPPAQRLRGCIRRVLCFFSKLKGPERNTVEEAFFSSLKFIAASSYNDLIFDSIEDKLPINRDEAATIGDERVKNRLKIFLEIEEFTIESYKYKRSRDSFGGQRRASALEINMFLLDYFKDSRGFELAAASLLGKSRAELNTAFDFFRKYYLSRELEPDEEIICRLQDIVDRTKIKTIAVGALSVLVDTGVVSEDTSIFDLEDEGEDYYC
ncbi:MAG: hypothetical protein KAW12_10035 [Candidatus Aminicenantes bacterium]|nr:hypothetical protein [Candidatus Aminicenantes bacterium]